MKTLHLNTERTWRGGERQMCSLAGGLQGLGQEPMILCRPASPCFERARAMGLCVRGFRTHGDLDVVAAHAVARMVDETGARIVHAHTARTVVPAAACKLFASRRVVCVAHRRVDFSIHKLPFRLSGLKYRYGIDRFIAITEAVKRVMTADGIPADKISVIHSSTDLSRFEGVTRRPGLRAELGIPEDAPLVGNVAALVGHKGQAFLLEAAAVVLRDFPEAFFLIVGEGPLRDELAAQARRLGIEDHLAMPGFREDVAECMAELDVFCMSSWGEGMGSVVLEAMAMRLPIVATRAGGLVEVVTDGEDGLLAPPRDARALAGAIGRLLADRDLGGRLGEHGRRTVAERFTVEGMVAKTAALYDELLRR